MSHPIKNFSDFWLFYLNEHRRPANRALHYVGTAIGLTSIVAAFVFAEWLLLWIPLAGYGLAWGGHFFVEGNRPASFRYRVWSLCADLRMFFLFLSGRLGAHLRQAARQDLAPYVAVGKPAMAVRP